jgi:putative transposase
MPRSARIMLPHTPHHIVQRGHNRQAVFTSDDDYNYYRQNIAAFKQTFFLWFPRSSAGIPLSCPLYRPL